MIIAPQTVKINYFTAVTIRIILQRPLPVDTSGQALATRPGVFWTATALLSTTPPPLTNFLHPRSPEPGHQAYHDTGKPM